MTRRAVAPAALLAGLLASSPVAAQQADPHAGHHMPGMTSAQAPAADPHAGHGAAGQSPQANAAADAAAEPTGTDQPPGSAEPPPVAHDSPAAHYWDAAAMAAAAEAEAEMHPPAPVYSKFIVDVAELQLRKGSDGYRWEGEAWFGNLDRFVIKSRGEGTRGGPLEEGEIQALYAKALDPWWNLQVGVRQDLRPRPMRTWATVAIDGRARYQFDVQAAVFLSDKGQVAARLEGSYDLRITQRLVFQPRAEVELAAQDMPVERIGSGLSTAELGLRLRYDLAREFAPYVGINWTWAAGRTADYARGVGDAPTQRSVVAGVRFWF